jgi:hypothetical protein
MCRKLSYTASPSVGKNVVMTKNNRMNIIYTVINLRVLEKKSGDFIEELSDR